MKRIAVLLSILCLKFAFCSCSDANISDTNTSDTNTQNTDDTSEPSTDSEELGEIEPLFAPESFGLFEEFEQHEKETGANGNS